MGRLHAAAGACFLNLVILWGRRASWASPLSGAILTTSNQCPFRTADYFQFSPVLLDFMLGPFETGLELPVGFLQGQHRGFACKKLRVPALDRHHQTRLVPDRCVTVWPRWDAGNLCVLLLSGDVKSIQAMCRRSKFAGHAPTLPLSQLYNRPKAR